MIAGSLRVDPGAAINLVARLIGALSVTLLVPAIMALAYGEPIVPFLAALAVGAAFAAVGLVATRGARAATTSEGVLVVALAWVFATVVGAVPYLVDAGQVGRVPDALFETMSGFTTTGASVMTDIEAHGRALLFWRSMTQWLGGMGIVVLALAVLPRFGGRALMENEAPGPGFDKLSPRIRETAARLWLLYVGFTIAAALAFWFGGLVGWSHGMDLYMSVSHAFTALATGGFSPDGRSLEEFGAYAQWVAVAAMACAGVNFGLWYRGLFRSWRWFARDDEFRVYFALIGVAGAVIALEIWLRGFHDLSTSIRHGIFQSVSIITTTGYASVDFAAWAAPLSLFLIVILMFVGGCAGSTGGSVKVVRHIAIWRALRREVRAFARPGLVQPVRVSGAVLDEQVVRMTVVFLVIYVAAFVVGTAVLLADAAIGGFDLAPFDAAAASATTLGNVGPGFGVAGPMGSFAAFGDVSTVTMTVLMWIGRLELLPVLALLSRAYWQR